MGLFDYIKKKTEQAVDVATDVASTVTKPISHVVPNADAGPKILQHFLGSKKQKSSPKPRSRPEPKPTPEPEPERPTQTRITGKRRDKRRRDMQAFREADQRASEQFAKRELARVEAGEDPISGEFGQQFAVDQLKRLATLEAQRENPGSVVVKRDGEQVLLLPEETGGSVGDGPPPAPAPDAPAAQPDLDDTFIDDGGFPPLDSASPFTTSGGGFEEEEGFEFSPQLAIGLVGVGLGLIGLLRSR